MYFYGSEIGKDYMTTLSVWASCYLQSRCCILHLPKGLESAFQTKRILILITPAEKLAEPE